MRNQKINGKGRLSRGKVSHEPRCQMWKATAKRMLCHAVGAVKRSSILSLEQALSDSAGSLRSSGLQRRLQRRLVMCGRRQYTAVPFVMSVF